MQQSSSHNSKKKFIDLMSTLTNRILQDPSNQFVIYQFLNQNDLKQLFDSLNDHQKSTRITAAFFICQLLKGNNKIIESLLVRQGSQVSPLPCNYMIGFNSTNVKKNDLVKIITISNKQKYHPQYLCWYINKQTFQVGHIFKDQKQFQIDPKDFIIGISLIQQQPQKSLNSINSSGISSRNSFQNKNKSINIKSTPASNQSYKKKYMIGKYK